jgi:hypothetical protein
MDWQVGKLPVVSTLNCPSGWGSWDPFSQSLSANCDVPTTAVLAGSWIVLSICVWAAFWYSVGLYFAIRRDGRITVQTSCLPVSLVALFFVSATFAFPEHLQDGHGIPLAAGVGSFCAIFCAYMWSDIFQAALKTVLALDPRGLKEINARIKSTIPAQIFAIFTIVVSAILLAEASDQSTVASCQAVFGTSFAFSLFTTSILSWSIYRQIGSLPKAATALLRESRGRKLNWKLMRAAFLSIAVMLLYAALALLSVFLIFAKTGGTYFLLLVAAPLCVFVG